jgi:hypothetical protein
MKIRVLGLALLLVCFASSAHATVITFINLSGLNGDPFTTYSENGFTVTKIAGSGCVGKNFGNPVPSVFGGPVCDGGTSGTFSVTGGGTFSFNDIDLAANNGNLSYEFLGKLGGGTVFDIKSTLGTDTRVFHTIASSNLSAIDSLTLNFITAGTSWNFDNINVSSNVPEPPSWTLIGLGLAGLAAARRRLSDERRPRRVTSA